jgi:hypothetical protein
MHPRPWSSSMIGARSMVHGWYKDTTREWYFMPQMGSNDSRSNRD